MGLSSLRSSADFERVFAERRRLFKNGLTIYYRSACQPDLRLGIVTPKRFGKAVQRNQFRRRVREIVRRFDESPQGCEVIVCVNKPLDTLTFAVIQEALHWSLRKAGNAFGRRRVPQSNAPALSTPAPHDS